MCNFDSDDSIEEEIPVEKLVENLDSIKINELK